VRRPLALFAVMCLAGCGSEADHAARSSTATSSAPVVTPAPVTSDVDAVDLDAVGQSAARAVRGFYGALSHQNYAQAWAREATTRRNTLGGYDTWKAGYRTTTAMTLTSLEPTASDQSHARVRLTLRSTDRDVCGAAVHRRFVGSIDVRRWHGRWEITDSDIAKTSGGSVRTDRGSCPKAVSGMAGTAGSSTSSISEARTPSGDETKVCYPAVDIPAVDLPAVSLPAVDLPAVTLPATDVGGQRLPAQHIAAQHIPAQRIGGQHIAAQHIAGGCLTAPAAFTPTKTSVLEDGYDHLDPRYSSKLTTSYWSRAGDATSYPDPNAAGFGDYNAAGFPKNQYVRPYMRRDGTMVSGYWRNSPSDGLPTCRIISC
jgi:hypothetical protein